MNADQQAIIELGRDAKFDIQLKRANRREDTLANQLLSEGIELKSETWQWRQYGNIFIEFASGEGKPSGLAVTEAKHWVHELYADDGEQLLIRLVFRVDRLKEICRHYHKLGCFTKRGGDSGTQHGVLLPIRSLWHWLCFDQPPQNHKPGF